MRRTVMGVLAVLIAAGTMAYATSVRTAGMGGVSICVRDLENDPVAFNPARAALVKQTGVFAGMRVNRTSDENVQVRRNDRASGNTDVAETREDSQRGKDDEFSGMVYLNLRDNFTFGAYTSYRTFEQKRENVTRYSGRWEGNVAVSTRTYAWQDETRSYYNVPAFNFLAGYGIAGKYLVGAQYQTVVPYDAKEETRANYTDHGYTTSGDNTRLSTLWVTEQRTSMSALRTGALLPVSAKGAVDVVVGLSREKQTADGGYEARTDAWDLRSLYGYDVSDILRCGLDLQYSQSSYDREYSGRLRADEDDKVFSCGIGAAVTPQKALLAGMDIVYLRRNDVDSSYNYDGSVGRRTDWTGESLSLRLGVEQWLLAEKLVLRAGGIKNLLYEDTTKDDYIGSSYRDDIHSRSTALGDAFTAGCGWSFTRNIMVEYALSASGSTEHRLMGTYYF